MSTAIHSNTYFQSHPLAGRDRAKTAEALSYATTWFCFALLPITLAAVFMDDRLVNSISVWIKPLKFQLSLGVHFLTLGLVLGLINDTARASRPVIWAFAAAAASCIFEIVYITLQSARGRASHFNADTSLENIMYGVMGVGSLLLTIAPIVLGIQIWRNGRADIGPGLKHGAILGLVLGGIATIVTAGFMSSSFIVETGRWVNGVRNDSFGIPLMGWSGTGGDLRVSHFFSLHIMQALPVLGLMADRWAQGKQTRIVLTGVIAWLAIVIGTFVQALNGNPFIAWG
ncbi:MAG: hypothetical protein WCC66_10930 [Rhizobiaceae bacterium]